MKVSEDYFTSLFTEKLWNINVYLAKTASCRSRCPILHHNNAVNGNFSVKIVQHECTESFIGTH